MPDEPPNLIAIDPEPLGAGIPETMAWAQKKIDAGQVSSIAIVIVDRQGKSWRNWSFLPSRTAMLGAVSRLAHRLNLEIDE